MRLFRIYVENSRIINQVWWGKATDQKLIELRSQILEVFPNEIWDYEPHIFGVSEDAAVVTIHQCVRPDKLKDDIMYKVDFNRYIYDLNNGVKTYEMFYNEGDAQPAVNVPAGLEVKYISEMLDASITALDKQSIYVQGDLAQIYEWANDLDPTIPKPINVSSKVHDVDSFQFQFDGIQLTNIRMFARPTRRMVRGIGKTVIVEYSADYYDDISNADQSPLVKSKYDVNGYQVANEAAKTANENVYVKVPFKDGSGHYRIERLAAKDAN
jgi:hypothetical protein